MTKIVSVPRWMLITIVIVSIIVFIFIWKKIKAQKKINNLYNQYCDSVETENIKSQLKKRVKVLSILSTHIKNKKRTYEAHFCRHLENSYIDYNQPYFSNKVSFFVFNSSCSKKNPNQQKYVVVKNDENQIFIIKKQILYSLSFPSKKCFSFSGINANLITNDEAIFNLVLEGYLVCITFYGIFNEKLKQFVHVCCEKDSIKTSIQIIHPESNEIILAVQYCRIYIPSSKPLEF